ncbi:hypothetical protein yberc0001_15860 [Yersinia bercovieri ATCC 43970]|uniref:Uncharacterized protein n=1 Tax=Yersinia bercovieri ATCC 43970 TaxID=349968 RepID=A0ABM9XXI8_YERBE|nr:hypothetical protein yberc0001_15860 [Yersinia bercovieri ATCC 43970]
MRMAVFISNEGWPKAGSDINGVLPLYPCQLCVIDEFI